MGKILFRCDSSNRVGTGHVLRSFALAEHFSQNGWDVTFCGMFEEPDWLNNLLNKLDKVFIQSVEKTIENKNKYDVVVFDSYQINSAEQKVLSKLGKITLALVDDISDKISADLYVSTLPVEYLEKFKNVRNFLFGPKYSLIRKDIPTNIYENKIMNNLDSKPCLAIFSGGAVKREFMKIFLPQIFSQMEGWKIKIFSDITQIPQEFIFRDEVSIIEPKIDFYKELIDVDLIIATASVSSWEFLRMNIPLAVYAIYPNQINTYNYITKNKFAVGLGSTNELKSFKMDTESLENASYYALENRSKGKIKNNIVDGLGPTRIYNEIIKLI